MLGIERIAQNIKLGWVYNGLAVMGTISCHGKVRRRLCFICFFLTFIQFERQRVSGGGAEREGDTESEAGPRLSAVSTEPNVGLKPTNCEIMT